MTENREASLKRELLRVSEQFGIQLNKRKGQCILIDNNIAKFMVDKLGLIADSDSVLEIGPGFGVLTEKLLPRAKKVMAIEMDPKFCDYLGEKFKNAANFELIRGDAIKEQFPNHTMLISNVPYQISGPLIEKIALHNVNQNANQSINWNVNPTTLVPYPRRIILMLQNEFIEKMTSIPHAKTYGRLSVLSQLFFTITKLKKVPPSVFYPEPAVDSGIVELVPNVDIIQKLGSGMETSHFLEFLSGIFPYKNKTVNNALHLFLGHLQSNPSNYSPEFLNKLTPYIQNTTSFKIMDPTKRLWQLFPKDILELFLKI